MKQYVRYTAIFAFLCFTRALGASDTMPVGGWLDYRGNPMDYTGTVDDYKPHENTGTKMDLYYIDPETQMLVKAHGSGSSTGLNQDNAIPPISNGWLLPPRGFSNNSNLAPPKEESGPCNGPNRQMYEKENKQYLDDLEKIMKLSAGEKMMQALKELRNDAFHDAEKKLIDTARKNHVDYLTNGGLRDDKCTRDEQYVKLDLLPIMRFEAAKNKEFLDKYGRSAPYEGTSVTQDAIGQDQTSGTTSVATPVTAHPAPIIASNNPSAITPTITSGIGSKLWSVYGTVVSKVFGVNSADAVNKHIQSSRDAALAAAQSRFNNTNLTWADVTQMAQGKGYVTDPKTVIPTLSSGQILFHESSYDTPGNAAYKVETQSDFMAWEQGIRDSGWYNKVTASDSQIKDTLSYPGLFGSSMVNTINPGGNTIVRDIMSMASDYKSQSMPLEQKQAEIYNAIRSTFADDQTLEGSHTPAEVIAAQAGVCRDMASLIFNAYNAAGIPSTYHENGYHAWVETTNNAGNPVTIDTNAAYNFIEIPGSRGGAYVDYQGNKYSPTGQKYPFYPLPNIEDRAARYALADAAQLKTAAEKTDVLRLCSLTGGCVKNAGSYVTNNERQAINASIYKPDASKKIYRSVLGCCINNRNDLYITRDDRYAFEFILKNEKGFENSTFVVIKEPKLSLNSFKIQSKSTISINGTTLDAVYIQDTSGYPDFMIANIRNGIWMAIYNPPSRAE